jgi:hypothetical protein
MAAASIARASIARVDRPSSPAPSEASSAGEGATHGEDRSRWILDRVATHVFSGELFAREREDGYLIANATVEEVRRRSDGARRVSQRARGTTPARR